VRLIARSLYPKRLVVLISTNFTLRHLQHPLHRRSDLRSFRYLPPARAKQTGPFRITWRPTSRRGSFGSPANPALRGPSNPSRHNQVHVCHHEDYECLPVRLEPIGKAPIDRSVIPVQKRA
jgi:hypothetical protein